MTSHDHIVVEFTEEVGYKEPFTDEDFAVYIQNSTGYWHRLIPLYDVNIYTFMPSKTLSMYVNWDNDTDHDNLILISQDPHSTIEITYQGTWKLFNFYEVEVKNQSTAINYLKKLDLDLLRMYNLEFKQLWIFGVWYNILAWSIIFICVAGAFLTWGFVSMVPAYLTIYFTQHVYMS